MARDALFVFGNYFSFSRYELGYSQLYTAARRLRQWIAVTIVRRLVSEIDKCNSELAQYPLTPRIGVDSADTIEVRCRFAISLCISHPQAAAATVYVLGADDLAERICGIVSYLRPVAYSTDSTTHATLSAQQVVARCRVLSACYRLQTKQPLFRRQRCHHARVHRVGRINRAASLRHLSRPRRTAAFHTP